MAPPRSRAAIMRGGRAARNRFTHPDAVAISRPLMRSVIGGLFVALLVAEPALAGSILYATAASQQRIDGFCLGADGALSATPTVQIPTLGRLPRRVLVGNGVLYVAEADRIEAFAIGQHGGLRPLAGSEPVESLNPQDLTLNPDGKTRYVTHLGFLEAFALDAEGGLPKRFTSCVQGEATNDFLDAQATSGLLYVSADDVPGRIAVYRPNADGSLPQTGCGGLRQKDRTALRRPHSARTRLRSPPAEAADVHLHGEPRHDAGPPHRHGQGRVRGRWRARSGGRLSPRVRRGARRRGALQSYRRADQLLPKRRSSCHAFDCLRVGEISSLRRPRLLA